MVEPFLKWPGGKRWLVRAYPHLFPQNPSRHIEPFLGSGAVFFYFVTNPAILSDSNEELINTYKCIKERPTELDSLLTGYQKSHNKTFYYAVRSSAPKSEVRRAARFLYLNRTCFNGIFRVNLDGRFNVPMGDKTQVSYAAGHLEKISESLKFTEIATADFESTIGRAGSGDFVYIDPPYTVMHNNNNFVKYNDVLFSWEDQERLAGAVRLADKRGVMIFVSNADHASVRKLYKGFGQTHVVERTSKLAASSEACRPTTEIAITNYM